MQITGFDGAGWPQCVLTIGNFDGVHRGHQHVLKTARALASARNKPLVALTFDPHPRSFFDPSLPPQQLSNMRDKHALLQQHGVDVLWVLPFNANLAALSAESFIQQIVLKQAQASCVVVGHDFRFGHKREGNMAWLSGRAEQFNLTIVEVPKALDPTASDAYSSTRIRAAIGLGDMATASQLLGHPWRVSSVVVRGDQRGRTIGFPTANLLLDGYLPPKQGVYATTVRIDDHPPTYRSVANFGSRPTIGGKRCWLEVHLFDFNDDIYDRWLTVWFHHFIRSEQKFSGLDALKQQIALDCQAAQSFLQSAPNIDEQA